MASVKPSVMKSLEDYVAEISAICRIDRAVLFGSYAKGTQNKESDIDIAIFSKEINDSNRHKYMSLFLRHILKYKLDIQPLAFNTKEYNSLSDDFIAGEIRKKGIVIYRRV
ncbi:MAG: nucleotidyltransferase domain-containing protein [Nitrospirae bacterium]|nr:nucleotidyltransferase domain-containing protein [Nitrospirota bacterium]